MKILERLVGDILDWRLFRGKNTIGSYSLGNLTLVKLDHQRVRFTEVRSVLLARSLAAEILGRRYFRRREWHVLAIVK